MSKTKKIAIILAVVGILGGGVYLYFSSASWTYSDGSRAGVVVKFSHRGSFIKTWEGELSMGALDQGGVREKWEFSVNESVDGEGIVEQVEDALDSGERVKMHYREQRAIQSWKGSTKYFITEVEYLGK